MIVIIEPIFPMEKWLPIGQWTNGTCYTHVPFCPIKLTLDKLAKKPLCLIVQLGEFNVI